MSIMSLQKASKQVCTLVMTYLGYKVLIITVPNVVITKFYSE